jgi:long-chain fatty acid transport protein
MTRTIKLAVAAAVALTSTAAFATNGSTMIGVGAKSVGMGGTSIGIGHGAESALANPSLITTIKKDHEVSFGGTVFMPKVSVKNTLQGPGGSATESMDSAADMFVVPSVSLASKVSDNLYWGIGMWGTGGMGVDYRDGKTAATGGTTMQMVTSVQVMQFGIPLAYKTNGLSLGITPIVQYGALDINYEYPGNPNPGTPAQGTNFGTGTGQDLKLGYNLGASYMIAGATLGASYKSQIDMDYGNVMTKTISPFTQTGYKNTKLSTPAEIGVGASYVMGGHTLALDYKMIQWEDAEGYKDFEWENQNVLSLGYQYATKSWALRCGYTNANSPIADQKPTFGPSGETKAPNAAGISAGTANTFNLLGFPGIIESHVTVGGSYALSDTTSVDLAYAMSLENTEKFTNFTGADIETTHSQQALTMQLNYAF